MRSFIFLTAEGHTYQPNSEAIEPDCENLQVIGFAEGEDAASAFENLVKENEWLAQTSFRQVQCLELTQPNYRQHISTFHLKQ